MYAEMIEQPLRRLSHFFDCLIKHSLIGLRRLAISTHLPHKLQRRGADLLLCGGDFRIA
jgi:hypothetical protein